MATARAFDTPLIDASSSTVALLIASTLPNREKSALFRTVPSPLMPSNSECL